MSLDSCADHSQQLCKWGSRTSTASKRWIFLVCRICTNSATVNCGDFVTSASNITVHGLPSGVNISFRKRWICSSVKSRHVATCLQLPTPFRGLSSFSQRASSTSFGRSLRQGDGLSGLTISGSLREYKGINQLSQGNLLGGKLHCKERFCLWKI